MTLFALLFCAALAPSAFSDEIQLAPIIKNADTPGDTLALDPILPQVKSTTDLDSPSGALDETLRTTIAAPVSTQGVGPGALSEFRGLGKSAEDIDIQTLGLSLNPPQGGGFALYTFPEYLWSSFAYSLGPSLSGIDPQSVSGTLNLTPWTAAALSRGGSGERFTSAGSTQGYAQFSGGVRSNNAYAAVAGFSVGHLRGPSVGASTEWKMGDVTGYAHLLATSVTADVQGTIAMPTPNETLLSQRVIPIVQFDIPISHETTLKTSAFYDGNYLDTEDPSQPFVYTSRTQQVGTENALLTGPWKFGASIRGVSFHSILNGLPIDAPNQMILNLQVFREIELDSFLIEPTLQGVSVTDQGFLPGGSLGLKWELEKDLNVFSRTSVTHKIASLLQRYFQDQFDLANATLSPETDVTEILGVELHGKKGGATLQGMMQQRSNAQIFQILPSGLSETLNQGSAELYAVTANFNYLLFPHFEILDAVTWNSSNVDATNQSFPFLPTFINNLALAGHLDWVGKKMLLQLEWRTATSASIVSSPSFSSPPLPGYGIVNLTAKTEIVRGIQGGARFDNLMDKPIQWYPGYAFEGRSFSLFLSGEFE